MHQTAESLFIALLLVYTNYRPKTHDLTKLEKKAKQIDKQFHGIFPKKTADDKRLFDLLVKAYVDARYESDYVIEKEELKLLATRIKTLWKVTEKLCKEYINKLSPSY